MLGVSDIADANMSLSNNGNYFRMTILAYVFKSCLFLSALDPGKPFVDHVAYHYDICAFFIDFKKCCASHLQCPNSCAFRSVLCLRICCFVLCLRCFSTVSSARGIFSDLFRLWIQLVSGCKPQMTTRELQT